MIKEYVLDTYKIKINFVEQEERLGLGHAIYISRHTFPETRILIIWRHCLRCRFEDHDSKQFF